MKRNRDDEPPAVQRHLMVCISGSPFSERLIRTTNRLAEVMQAPWSTVYVETPGSGSQTQENREQVWKDLRLAERLGAEVALLTASSVAEAIIDHAVKHEVTTIVIGKPRRPRWRDFISPPLVDRIICLSGAIDVYVVSMGPPESKPVAEARGTACDWKGYLAGAALVIGGTVVGRLVHQYLAPTNLVMIYLLMVVVAAVRLGLKPAIATAFLSVLAFDFFLVPPHHTFAVADTEYLITFAALFTVGVVISSLVSQARERAEAVREREVQTATLYYLSRDLAAAADRETITGAVSKNLREALGAGVAVLSPEGGRLVACVGTTLDLDENGWAAAEWAFLNRQAAGNGTDAFGSAGLLCLLLQTSGTVAGVMGIKLKHQADYRNLQIRRLLDAFATQTALALERVELGRQAEQTQILQARENLERALLNSVSHDLRTPLVAITGALSTLRTEGYSLHEKGRRELVDAAWEEAMRLNRFVGNLLDMTRVQAGELKIRKELSDIQDLVGCGLAPLDQRLQGRNVAIDLSSDLPLVYMDMVLMTQVLVNLLDNAVKYSPPGTPVDISARADGGDLVLSVQDRGPGVPPEDLERIFGKFFRVPVPEGAGGTGLGLSICKGIVEAHGGTIRAENRAGGGLQVTVTIPRQ